MDDDHKDEIERRRKEKKDEIANLLLKSKKNPASNVQKSERLLLSQPLQKTRQKLFKTSREKYFDELEKVKPRASPKKNALSVSSIRKSPVDSRKLAVSNIKNKFRAVDSSLFVLNQNKRDLRTIEEIQIDMRRKKEASSKPDNVPQFRKQDPNPRSQPTSQRAMGIDKVSRSIETEQRGKKYSSDEKTRKRINAGGDEFIEQNYSSIIQNMFGYDRNKYRDIDYDSDEMEASQREIDEEERRSAYLARLEEENEERLLKEKQIEKEKRRRGSSK